MSVHKAILDALAVEFEKVTGVGCRVSSVASHAHKLLWAMRISYGGTFLGTLYAIPDGIQFQWNAGPKSKPRSSWRVDYADPAFESKALTILRNEIALPEPRWQNG